ncbi:MAG: type III secretion system outer membrane ring subunit SctC [Pseudomonadales bacterium]|nr:type III secretion system outer membrane ring subunit SctC [Pseudomonadales bacterium]
MKIDRLLLLMVGLLLCNGVLAKPVPFSTGEVVSYDLRAERLADFLYRFCEDQGYGIVLSDKITSDRRTLNGIRKGDPKTVFRSVIDSNNLVAYFDGSKIYVSSVSEVKRQYFHLSAHETKELKNTFKYMAIFDDSNYVKFLRGTSFMEIVGVPYFVDQITNIYSSLKENSELGLVFEYFPLKYAWANDRTIVVGNKEVKIEGVAKILRAAIGDVSPHISHSVSNDRSDRSWYYGGADKVSPKEKLRSYTDKLNSGMPINLSRNTEAYIVADPQHNAIIVRDHAERIPLYKSLIEKLDKPSQLVEIEATIIDVNNDKLQEAGVDWRYGKSDREAVFSDEALKPNLVDVIAGEDVSLLDQQVGFQLGAIIGNKNRFLARVNLLEEDGMLEVTSKPKVATLNDLEAVIESSRSVYVPVEGAYDVNLFQVFSGTILRVTPHVIADGDNNRILMVIAVEDGTVELTGENQTPQTTKHSVSTQAMVSEGKSLLLGGLVRTEATKEESKVPLLGDIPLLGKLFRSTSSVNRKTERLFLITPRLISPDGKSLDELARTEMSDQGSLN